MTIGSLSFFNEFNIVGGSGSEADKNYNDFQAQSLDIKTNFLGWLNREELNHINSKSHILILPTFSEGFPKVVAEAACFGCIPIVTNIAPINQYIVHHSLDDIVL